MMRCKLRFPMVGMVLALACAAVAGTWNEVVTSELDTSDPGSLRAAVAKAVTAADTVNITFAESMKDKTIVLGSTINVNGNVNLDGGGGGVKLDGQGACRLFDIRTVGARLSMDSLTLQNFRPGSSGGGAIRLYAENAECGLRNCRFENCRAAYGSAIYISENSRCRIFDCTFAGNATEGSSGYDGTINNDGDLLVFNTTFADNVSRNPVGGAAISQNYEDGAQCRLYNCTFFGNSASGAGAQGGAVYVVKGKLEMAGCLAGGNAAAGGVGGDFYVATPESENCHLCRTGCSSAEWQGAEPEKCRLGLALVELFGTGHPEPQEVVVKGVKHTVYPVADEADAAVKANGLAFQALDDYSCVAGFDADHVARYKSGTTDAELDVKLIADQVGTLRVDAVSFTGLQSDGITLGAVQRRDPAHPPVVLTFETNGGSAVDPIVGDAGSTLAAPSDPVRHGYVFGGWFADAAFADPFEFTTMPDGDTTVYAKWRAIVYSISYTLRGGVGNSGNPVTYTIESRTITLTSPKKKGYEFAGWSPEGTIPTGSTGDRSFVATWTPTVNPITYKLNGGTNAAGNPDTYTIEDATINLVDPIRAGYRFEGWTPNARISMGSTGDRTFTANWSVIDYPIAYRLDGGVNSPENRTDYTVEDSFALAAPTRKGYIFLGWSPTGCVPAGSTGAKTFTALWEKAIPALFVDADSSAFTGDATYNGWIRNADDTFKGLISVKSAKPKNGVSKLTITYTPMGEKKQSIKGITAQVVPGASSTVDIPGLGTVLIGGGQIAAADGSFQVAVDHTKSKDRAAKSAALAALARFQGVKAFALLSSRGHAAFSLTIDKKGKGKLAGVLPDGTKVSISSQGILGRDERGGQLAIPFGFSRQASFALVFWVHSDGTVEVSDFTGVALSDRTVLPVDDIVCGAAGALPNGADHVLAAPGFTQPFAVEGKKWSFPKQDKRAAVDPNPYGAKLAFAPKTGVVKGALSLPAAAATERDPPGAAAGAKPGKYTVNGVVVGDKFYGTAYNKKAGAFPVAAE